MYRSVLAFFSSLRLTVVLLVLSMLLIFFSTLDQVTMGIRGAQQVYFESFFAVWRYPQHFWLSEYLGWFHLPLLGGAVLGPMLLLNLMAAHFKRYRGLSWRKLGISLTHGGILLLLLALMAASWLQEDHRMQINEGGTRNFLESFYDYEWVLVDESAESSDRVYAFPEKLLEEGTILEQPDWPFRVRVRAYYANSVLGMADPAMPSLFSRGVGKGVWVGEAPISGRLDEPNIASASIELLGANGESMGLWLTTTHPALAASDGLQRFEWEGRQFAMGLRAKRTYLPFSLELIDFSYDRYPGTERARNFSSDLRLRHEEKATDRRVLVYMNHPLRYEGWTFYQSSFSNDERTSIFQVVTNPSWLLPYIACLLVTVGLLFQFTWRLIEAGRRMSASAAKPAAR